MALGLIYYISTMSVFLVFYYYGDKNELLLSLVKSMFPDNYLLSISAFMFLYYFLFHGQEFKKPTKAKKTWFRLASFIPLIYILVSYVLSALDEASIISIHYLVSTLLSGQFFLQEVVGLVVIYFFYFLRRKDIKAGKKPK